MEKRTFALAQPSQTEQIFSIYRAAIVDMCTQNIEQWDEIYPALHDIEGDISRQEMFIATAGNNILSAVTINEEQDPTYAVGCWRYNDGPIAVIHRLCVHPKAQGMGVGKWTMQRAQDTLRQRGYNVVRLDAFAQNPASNALYCAAGYQRAGEIQLRKGRFFLYEKRLTD